MLIAIISYEQPSSQYMPASQSVMKKVLEIRKYLTADHIYVYNRVFEEVINNKGTIANASKIISHKDQSAITKTINSLNERFYNVFGEKLLWRIKNSNKWRSSTTGRLFYKYSVVEEIRFIDLYKSITKYKKNIELRIAIYPHSFNTFMKIDREAKNFIQWKYVKSFTSVKSKNIPNILLSDHSVDIAIGESLICKAQSDNNTAIFPTENTLINIKENNIEYICIEEDEYFMISNYTLPKKYLIKKTYKSNNKRIPIMRSVNIRHMNVMIVSHGIILDYIINIIDGKGVSIIIEDREKIDYLNKKINISHEFNSIDLLVDVLLSGEENSVIFGTKTIFDYITHKSEVGYKNNTINEYIHIYKIKEDRCIQNKLMYWRKEENNYGSGHPYTCYINAAKNINMNMNNKIKNT